MISKTRQLFLGCLACLSLAVTVASAQDQYPLQSQQRLPSQQQSTMSNARYIPPGYAPDMNMYWSPSGRCPEVLRPTPPGFYGRPLSNPYSFPGIPSALPYVPFKRLL